jgi:hypothetical protein
MVEQKQVMSTTGRLIVPGKEEPIPPSRINADVDEKNRLLRLSEISLWLDGYDDIFSDFDPRPYSERALSDDFLSESKKAAREKTSGTIDLKFLIPSSQRDIKLEEVIRKRLHEHFRKHHHLQETEVHVMRRDGFLTILLGFTIMMVSTYLRSIESASMVQQFMFVVLEPGGWFVTWFGLDQIFYASRQKKADLEFYSKMSRCEIHFLSY